jgi:hypothetical protein
MKSSNDRGRQPARTLLSCALASCLAVLAPHVLAQSAAGSLRGQVTGSAGPVADVIVSATNLGTGTVRRVNAGTDGSYTLAGLPPGTYRVDVQGVGASSSQVVTVQVGQALTLDLEMATDRPAVDAVTMAGVEVTGTRMAETRTSELATYVTPEQIAALPQINRNFLSYADLVPGVQFTTAGDGSTQLRSGAQGASAVNVFIDGVSQKSYTLPGGISGQDSSRGNPFPQSAIGEYKVITQNYKAEFDQIGSAAVVAATRGGTNEFHGELFYDRFDQDMRASTPIEQRDGGNKTQQLDEQYGVTMGGPILRDRLHFFVAYEGKQIVSPRNVIPGQGVQVEDLPAQFQGLTGSTQSPFRENLYFARLDLAASDRSFFEFNYKFRDEEELTGIGGVNTATFGTNKDNQETRAALRWQYIGDTWLNDAQFIYEDLAWNPRPATEGVGYVLTNQNPWDVILNVGAGRDFQNKGQDGWGFQNDFSLTHLEWRGYHLVKMGIKYKEVTVSAQEQQPYSPQFFYDRNQSLTVPYQVSLGVPLNGVGDGRAESDNTQFGIYVQDDWELNRHLTLNLGARWDYEKSPTYIDYRTPGDVAAALRGWDNINNANAGYDINDYISDGSQRKAFTTGIQPRLGFSWDFNGDQRTVLFGGIGRSYDRNLFDRLQLELTKATFPTVNFLFDTPGHACSGSNCLAWDPVYFDPGVLRALASTSGVGREINLIHNDLKMPYSDQASLGIRHMIGDWQTEATLSRVESHDGFLFLLGNRHPDGSFFAPGTAWGAPWGFGVPGFGALILGTNGLKTRANSLFLKSEKPYTEASGWGVTVAYTYTDAEENRQFNEVYSLDYPTIEGFGWKQAGGIPEHRLVMTGLYSAPWDITLSGKYQIATATPRYGINCFDGGDFCRPDQFLPGGIGFEQFDLAAFKAWDIGAGLSLKARLDVLNVFNKYNWAGYDTWFGFAGVPNDNLGKPDRSLAGPTRTVKISLGIAW